MQIDSERQDELKKYTFLVYILQAFGFVIPILPIVGIIINFIKDDDVRGSWLETHFAWQKNTFWYGLLWTILGVVTAPFLIGYAVLGLLTIWFIYRIARGWIYLVDGKEMYRPNTGEIHE